MKAGYHVGAVVGAALGVCVVGLYGAGVLGWQWVLAGPPLVIAGAICGSLRDAW